VYADEEEHEDGDGDASRGVPARAKIVPSLPPIKSEPRMPMRMVLSYNSCRAES